MYECMCVCICNFRKGDVRQRDGQKKRGRKSQREKAGWRGKWLNERDRHTERERKVGGNKGGR